jgi:hypothetical protein
MGDKQPPYFIWTPNRKKLLFETADLARQAGEWKLCKIGEKAVSQGLVPKDGESIHLLFRVFA